MDNNIKVPTKEKIFFGLGDVFGGGGSTLVGGIFFTYLILMGLEPYMSGIIVVIARIWDAVIDPFLGVLGDNTRTKYGRRRPFIFLGGCFIILALLWLFAPLYAIRSPWLKFFIYLFGYLFFNTVCSVATLAYNAMSSEISTDYKERNDVNVIRLVFSMLSSLVATLAPVELINMYIGGKISIWSLYFIIALAFGVFFTVPVLLSAVFSKERIELPAEKSVFSVKQFLTPFKVKAFIFILGMYFFAYSCVDVLTSNIIFFVKYALKANVSSTIVLGLIAGFTAVIAPFMYLFMRKGLPKPVLYAAGIPFFVLGALLLSLYQGNDPAVIYVFAGLIGLGASSLMLPWIIFPDVMDVAELKLGSRPTGSFSGLMSFIKTCTSGISVFLVGIVLSATGFMKPETDPVTGAVTKEFVQPASAILGLRLVIAVPVVILMGAAFFCAMKLKLGSKRVFAIKRLLDARKEGSEVGEEDKIEFEKIKKELF
jgi:Na+/melibiose symporter and related transporters